MKDFPFVIKDEQGNLLYRENSNGDWYKWEYDYNEIYFETSDGDWGRWEYDSEGNEIYYKDSDGFIIDKRIAACGSANY